VNKIVKGFHPGDTGSKVTYHMTTWISVRSYTSAATKPFSTSRAAQPLPSPALEKCRQVTPLCTVRITRGSLTLHHQVTWCHLWHTRDLPTELQLSLVTLHECCRHTYSVKIKPTACYYLVETSAECLYREL